MSDFFRKHGLILSEVFGREQERSKNLEKIVITVQKIIFLRKSVETRFLDIEKSNSERLLKITLNASQSPEDSL